MDRYFEVVGALLNKLGVGDTEPSDQGVFTIYVEDDLPVFLRPNTTGEVLVLHAGIGVLADADPGTVGVALLKGTTLDMEANGFALGMVAGTDLVVLVTRQPVAEIEEEALYVVFDRFVAAAVGWRDVFESLVAGASAATVGNVADPNETTATRPVFTDFV